MIFQLGPYSTIGKKAEILATHKTVTDGKQMDPVRRLRTRPGSLALRPQVRRFPWLALASAPFQPYQHCCHANAGAAVVRCDRVSSLTSSAIQIAL